MYNFDREQLGAAPATSVTSQTQDERLSISGIKYAIKTPSQSSG